jgi:hypothetical protein
MRTVCLILMGLWLVCMSASAQTITDYGYLKNPPVFMDTDRDVALTLMGPNVPQVFTVSAEGVYVEADGFNKNGVDVQRRLIVDDLLFRLSAAWPFGDGGAIRAVIPYSRNRVRGFINGLNASGESTGFGDLGLIVNKRLFLKEDDSRLVASLGVDLPTGKDDEHFDFLNASTRGYYSTDPGRIPIGWQAGTKTTNFYGALAYGFGTGRTAYTAMVAAKIFTKGFEDSKVGNVFIAALGGTYGLSKTTALTAGLTLRSQKNDEYPNAPAPGVEGGILQGTSLNGTSLIFDPSFRWDVHKNLTIGVKYRVPIVDPDDGDRPFTRFLLLLYPKF